jgi:hypothetical protein
VDTTCALMAARLRAVATGQKRVVRGLAVGIMRDVVSQAEQRYSTVGTLARKLWGTAYWTGRKATMRSLGLSRRTAAAARVGTKWSRWRKDLKRGANAMARAQRRGGSGVPLIVRIQRTRWQSDTLRTGVAVRGAASNVETGTPFKAHGRHPGGAVSRHPVVERVMGQHSPRIGPAIRAGVEGYMAGVLGG